MDPINTPLPEDDLSRTFAQKDVETEPHLSIVGNTYTTVVSGAQTGGRYCIVDMFVAPGAGPPPHRHDFDESFTVLEGQVEATFRGETMTVKTGETIAIPSNAPHAFRNAGDRPARLLCVCSPAGEEEFFTEIGVPVPTRTSPPPPMSEGARAQLAARAKELAPKYRTEILDR